MEDKIKFYRKVADKHDLTFKRFAEDWIKMAGHACTIDVRLDHRTGEEFVTIIASGKSKLAEHLLISIEAWNSAKKGG